METDQVDPRRFQIRNLVNVAAPRNNEKSCFDPSGMGRYQPPAGACHEGCLSCHSLDNENAARRIAMVVDRALLPAPPAQNQDFVGPGEMDPVSLIGALVEVDASPQGVSIQAQSLKTISDRVRGDGRTK